MVKKSVSPSPLKSPVMVWFLRFEKQPEARPPHQLGIGVVSTTRYVPSPFDSQVLNLLLVGRSFALPGVMKSVFPSPSKSPRMIARGISVKDGATGASLAVKEPSPFEKKVIMRPSDSTGETKSVFP